MTGMPKEVELWLRFYDKDNNKLGEEYRLFQVPEGAVIMTPTLTFKAEEFSDCLYIDTVEQPDA